MTPQPFLTASWRYLAMLNFAIDPKILDPHVPAGTELDAWHGTHFVSVVGFRFLNTRVRGVAIPGHRDFDEVNLRFYVRRRLPDGAWRRGVVFIKEIVPRAAIAAVARLVYGEPYVWYPMRHDVEMSNAADGIGGRVRYEWYRSGRWSSLEVRTAGRPADFAVGSEEEFITEHYWGYTARSNRTTEYEVRHPPWRVWRASIASLDCDVAPLYGAVFEEALTAEPHSAFLAEGSEVSVYPGEDLQDEGDGSAA